MAFLCPSMRMRRDKKKATNATVVPIPVVGRITGSASIETLVRVGIEKEHGLSPDSKMVVLHDFTPCVDDELEVKRGQLVNILYRENDWVYVIGQDSRQEGFIPYSYCVPYNSPLADLSVKKKLPREQTMEQGENIALLSAVETPDEAPAVLRNDMVGVGIAVLKNSEVSNLIHQPECTPFRKDPSGRFIVLYTFIARDENDISVERGEFVTLLNREDPDWFWIVRSDGQEGFIPSAFVYAADSVLQTHQKLLNTYMPTAESQSQNTNLIASNNHSTANANKSHHAASSNEHMTRTLNRNLNRIAHPPPLTAAAIDSSGIPQQQEQVQHQHPQMALSAEDLRFHGTELVVLYDYKAQAPDDLSVRGGEWIYADLNNQTVDGWLWAYAPKTRKYGFIPQTYARPQPQTQL